MCFLPFWFLKNIYLCECQSYIKREGENSSIWWFTAQMAEKQEGFVHAKFKSQELLLALPAGAILWCSPRCINKDLDLKWSSRTQARANLVCWHPRQLLAWLLINYLNISSGLKVPNTLSCCLMRSVVKEICIFGIIFHNFILKFLLCVQVLHFHFFGLGLQCTNVCYDFVFLCLFCLDRFWV